MSAPVDVLAVMDDAAQVLGRDGNRAMAEARAAVAELIDALSDYPGMNEPSFPGTPRRLCRVRTALARVQGGAK